MLVFFFSFASVVKKKNNLSIIVNLLDDKISVVKDVVSIDVLVKIVFDMGSWKKKKANIII